MAEDFEVKVTADLDTSAAESKLESFLNQKQKLKIDVELNQDSAKKMTSSIEKGLKQTKLDTTALSKQLAGSFNITDKETISQIKSQMNGMITNLSKAWNGTDFIPKSQGMLDFAAGMEPLQKTIAENAKILEGSTGIYDDFFNYFKDKKIYVSDELKNALGADTYKELLQNNIGQIVRDASKGVDISSIWGEMQNLFPQHFSENIITQADQITHAFDLMKQARADMAQQIAIPYQDMDGQTKNVVNETAWQQVSAASGILMNNLKSNIQSASEAAKTTIDLDVNVNTDKISSDIRNAIQNAGGNAGEAMKLDLKMNEEQLASNLRAAIGQITTGDEPVKVDIQINKESLKSDLTAALTDMDLPVKFKIDAGELEKQIRAAIENIKDAKVDIRVNTDTLKESVGESVTESVSQAEAQTATVRMPTVDTANMSQFQQMLGNINNAGKQGKSVFESLGMTFKQAFSMYSGAYLLQDGINRVIRSGKEALSTVKEFNDIKTDLGMVTGQSKSYINDLMQSYNDLGQELGSVTSDVAMSADTWLRQGRSMEDTNQLIKDSMVLSKDAQMDSDQAAEVLTATLNGFQMSADQAGHINDVLNSIDLISASDAGGIGTALERVASQANNAGMSLEKTAAIIATIKDVTQGSDETIGNSLKSILARMNNIKAGKFIDDNGEALNDVEKVLNKIGISMRDNNNQFLDSESVIDKVAKKWDTLDKKTQKAVSTALGGTYQANSVVAMLDNYDKVQKLTEAAYNSDGSAQQKFEENYLTSLEAKTNALKASMENVATGLVSDNLYGGFLDGAKAVADFTAQTDLLKASLAGLGAAGGVYAFQQLISLFKEFSNLGNALNLSKMTNMSADSFSQLLVLTQGLSESQTKLVLSSTALSNAQRVAVMMNQGMTEAQASATVASMGLATAEGTAATATFSLSGALSGLWATLMANPLIFVAAGVTAAVAAFSSYSNSVKEAVSAARESGSTWEENNTSIEDNISRIQELRTELASGTLTEQEAADAKSELLSIQESLTDSYGDQVQGIDLINGSLEDQIKLLDEVSQKQSENYLNENKKTIDKAAKEMEKNRHTYVGRFYDDGSEESEALKTSLKNLQDTYGDEIVKLDKSADGFEADIHINADAAQAKEVLNDLMTELSGIEDQYGESDTLDLMMNNASTGLNDAKDVLDEYRSIYEQAQKAELKSDKTLYSAGDKEQTAAKWLSDYAKVVDDYNKAVSEGDDSKIKEAAASFDTMDSTMQGLTKGSMAEYADQIQEVREQLNETAIANDKFTKAVKGSDSSEFGKTVSDNAKALKELNLTDTDFKYAFETDGIQEGEDAVNSLVDAAMQCGVISDTSSEQVSSLVNMLVQLGVISSSTGAGLDGVSDSASNLASQIETVNSALSGIEKASSLLDSQSTGKSISIDDFNSDELADYTSALEYNNGALQLNAEKVRELQKAKAEEAIQTNDNQKLEMQNQYMENIAEIEQLQEELKGLSDAKSDNAQSIQESIDALLSENDGIVNQCNQLDLLSASLREATGAYQNWLDKQNASESGDMFDDAMGALQHIEDTTQNTESEYYGRTGRNDYKAAVDFIVPDTIDHEDEEAVSSYIDSIEHYFNHDEDGNRTGLDVAEFCAKATKAGLMELDEASGEYKIAGQRTMQDFVDGLGLSMPMVQAMFGEMEEFNGQFDWADESLKTLGDLGMAAGEAKSRIEEMSGDTGMDIQIDVSDIENTEDKISTLDNTIQQMQDYKGTVEVDSSQVDDANAVIQYCVTQKQMLEQPAVMSVDTSQVDGELGNALSLLQQFQTAQNNVELQAAVGADTSEAQGQVDSLVSEIQGLSPEIQAQLNIDTTSADTITASLQELTPEIMVKAGVDSSLVDSWASTKKKSDGKVKWTNETSAVDAWASQMHTSNGQVTWTNDESQVKKTFTAIGTVNWTNTKAPSGTKSGGTIGVNGTAHAAGTAHYNHLVGHAYAEGNWGTKTGGTTLVGELGRELVVDPGSGTWHTVGDNGAEFTNIPAGSIVFNHKQTEALLERGFVAGRGTARANGTAMVRGGISVKQANIASHKTTYSGSNSTNDKTTQVVDKAAKDVSKAAQKSSKWTDPWKNAKDWFERVVKKLQNIIDLNKAKADNDYKYQQKNLLADNSMDTTERLIKNYKAAAKMYTKQSNKYAKEINLPKNLKRKVQNGTVDIQKLSEVNKQKVEAYQKWYDKINDCKKAIEELKTKERELAQQKLENITNRYDALIKVYSNRNSKIDNINSMREELGESQGKGSSYYKSVESQISNGKKMRNYYKDEIYAYELEYNRFAKKYGKNSTEAKEAFATLEELKSNFYENEKNIAENQNKLFELQNTVAGYKVDKYTQASDALESFRKFKDANNYKDSKYGKVTESDYVEAINVNDQTISAIQAQKELVQKQMSKYSVDSSKYQELKKTLADLNKQELEAANSNAELKKSIVDLRFKPFDDAKESLDNLITDFDNLRNMMDSDTFMEDNGSFTKQGLANISLINQAAEATKQQIANYNAQLAAVEKEYQNHNITEEDYKQRTKDLKSSIQQASQSLNGYEQSLIQVYSDQISKENDYLQENIDKRKTALSKKKEYYDYDKTLKDKNKDINALKAQIAALEGTTNAASKAKLEKLKADLKEKQDDLADTKYDHQIDMETQGYENLSDQANDSLDKTLKEVKSNSAMQKAVIEQMLQETQNSYSTAYDAIQNIIKETGYKVSDNFNEIIEKAKLTNTEVAKIRANVTSDGTDSVDDKRKNKNKADAGVDSAAGQSNTEQNATNQPGGKPKEESLRDTPEKRVKAWFKALPKYTGGEAGMKNASSIMKFFYKKGKKPSGKSLQELAKILGESKLAKTKYKKWSGQDKARLLKIAKAYGYSSGGVVGGVIPLDPMSLYGQILNKTNDKGVIFARPGETMMTEKFTELLKPSVDMMDQFTKLSEPKGTLPNTQVVNRDINFNPQITLNVDSISSDMDVKKLAKQLGKYMYPDFTKALTKDARKLTGRNL